MAWWKRPAQLLAVVALASTLASADDCKSDKTFVIGSQDDADKLAKCSEFSGDVGLAPSARGNVTVGGVEKISGKLLTEEGSGDASLTAIRFEKLKTVEGSLSIGSIKSLTSIHLPLLETVGGAVEFKSLPELEALRMPHIRSVGKIRLEGAPKLNLLTVGDAKAKYGENWASRGLRHITDEADRSIVVRDVGAKDLDGLLDLYNATLVDLSELPNLDQVRLTLWNVDEVRIRGNGKLAVYMREGDKFQGVPEMNIGKLDIAGVGHVSPCLSSDVSSFVAANNTVEFLHFSFRRLKHLEVRDNPKLKTLVPFFGNSDWFLKNLTIRNNPELVLARQPARDPKDNRTAEDCPYMFGDKNGEWKWYPWDMNVIDVDANIDNTFFSHFTEAWEKQTGSYREGYGRGPNVYEKFSVASTDASFDCSGLERVRTETTAINGTFTCQGKSAAAFVPPERGAAGRLSSAGLLVALVPFVAASVFL